MFFLQGESVLQSCADWAFYCNWSHLVFTWLLSTKTTLPATNAEAYFIFQYISQMCTHKHATTGSSPATKNYVIRPWRWLLENLEALVWFDDRNCSLRKLWFLGDFIRVLPHGHIRIPVDATLGYIFLKWQHQIKRTMKQPCFFWLTLIFHQFPEVSLICSLVFWRHHFWMIHNGSLCGGRCIRSLVQSLGALPFSNRFHL